MGLGRQRRSCHARPESSDGRTRKGGVVLKTLVASPDCGCDEGDTPHGTANIAKPFVPTGSAKSVRAGFGEFQALQKELESREIPFGRLVHISAEHCQDLQKLPMNGRTLGEQSMKRHEVCMADNDNYPKQNAGESVNCDLRGQANNPFPIILAPDPESQELDRIVAETVTQDRPDGWGGYRS
jgi:hypothetical protein